MNKFRSKIRSNTPSFVLLVCDRVCQSEYVTKIGKYGVPGNHQHKDNMHPQCTQEKIEHLYRSSSNALSRPLNQKYIRKANKSNKQDN